MITIWVSSSERKGVTELPNGPFPITAEQLRAVRAAYQTELARSVDGLDGVRLHPQTVARDLLALMVPSLPEFDRLIVGFAVTAFRVRTTTL